MITIQRDWTTDEISISTAKRLLRAAREMLEYALSEQDIDEPYGICFALARRSYSTIIPMPMEILSRVSVALVCKCAMRWKHKASATPGSYTSFPILEDLDFGKWEGPNLEARISLLRYVIKRLSDTVHRAEKNGKAALR